MLVSKDHFIQFVHNISVRCEGQMSVCIRELIAPVDRVTEYDRFVGRDVTATVEKYLFLRINIVALIFKRAGFGVGL